MAFSSWDDLRTAIKDALYDQVNNGGACVGEYEINGRHLVYRSYEQLVRLLKQTYQLEAIENEGSADMLVSYGKFRNFD